MSVTSSRAARHAWVLGVGVVTLLAAAPASTSAFSHPDRPGQATNDVRLELFAQRFAIDPNGAVRLSYVLTGLEGDPLQLIPAPPTVVPPSSDPIPPVEPEPVTLTVEVTNYPRLTDIDDVAPLIGSGVDSNAFRELAGDPVDGVAFDARPLLEPNDDGSVTLTLDIGTDVADSVETRLKMDQPGIYPLRVQLLVGDRAERNVFATAGTVIQRLAGAGDTEVEVAPPIDLSVVTVTPAPEPSADEATIERARTQLDEAIDLAAQLDAPVTLQVPPTLIAEQATTPAGSEQLASALAGDALVALPLLPLDVSSAVAAGRADAYTRLARAGEAVLTSTVPTTPSRRDVWMTTEPLSAGGAQHLRDLGTRFIVIGAELYADTISSEPVPTDRFVEAELPDGGTMPFLVVGPISEELTSTAADRILAKSTSIEWGVQTLAELLVEQSDEDAEAAASTDRPTAPPRRSNILTTPDMSSPDVRLLQALTELVATTPSVRFTSASRLPGVTDVAVEDGEPISVRLPEVAGPSLVARVELIDATALELASAASMLPPDDPRPAEWAAELDGLISTGYSDAEVEAATSELSAEAEALKQAVTLPEPFTFTLTGRRGTIEIRIGNTLDEPLDVVVALDASKITFPDGDQRVTLRPLDETSVIVPVDAEANGTSSINLVVSTPAGEALGEPVTLTARVTALTGLGQVLTGGFVLVLLTWWFTHWRNRRRAALVDDGRERHPTSGKVGSDPL